MINLHILIRNLLIGFLATICLFLVNSARANQPLILLELFTSQGCYSCPPAEKLLAKSYLNHPDLLALELHVDYWDDLVYKGSVWEDPYSANQFTQRQRDYSTGIFKSIFTPQMVIQGNYSAVGDKEEKINKAIANVKKTYLEKLSNLTVTINKENTKVAVLINNLDSSKDLLINSVVFLKQVTTNVTAGENKGKVLANHNVVTKFTQHNVTTTSFSFELELPNKLDYDCAVIIQEAPPDNYVYGVWPCS